MSDIPDPIHRSRAARLIRAQIDGDRDKAARVVEEAVRDDALIELTNAVAGITVGTLRLATKGNVEYMRGYVDDLILKAQIDIDACRLDQGKKQT